MELSFKELKKRDVINVSDGRCLGNITDLTIDFPEGELSGIIVPGRKSRGIFSWFDKTEIFIDVTRIVKIGNDVILVDLRCEDGGKRREGKRRKEQHPPRPSRPPENNGCGLPNCEDLIGAPRPEPRIDTSDY